MQGGKQVRLLCCYSCFRSVVVVVFLCCCCSFVAVFVVRVDVAATVIVVLVVLSFGRRRRCCSCACCPLSVRVVVVVVAFLILSKSQQMRSESLATGTDRVGVCGIPVPKEVAFADSSAYERMQGAAGLSSELRPTTTSDGRCENVPAGQTQISSEPRNPDELVCGVLLLLVYPEILSTFRM